MYPVSESGRMYFGQETVELERCSCNVLSYKQVQQHWYLMCYFGQYSKLLYVQYEFNNNGTRGSVVKALFCNPEGRGINTRRGECIF
jgi:hypothetical protein